MASEVEGWCEVVPKDVEVCECSVEVEVCVMTTAS